MHWLAVGMCIALFGVVLATPATAQNTDEKSYFNLTEPMDVGSTTLQPGNYNIRVVPQRGDRNLLQVWSADGTKLFATLLSVPHPEGWTGVQVPESRYVYYPASANHIKALRTWFASNTPASGGHDIVYPKSRAMELAALVKEPVIALAEEVKEPEYATAPLVVVTPELEVKPYEVAKAEELPVAEEAPVQVAENITPERLPQTASNVPLYAGLGLLSLLGALGLGVLARRVA